MRHKTPRFLTDPILLLQGVFVKRFIKPVFLPMATTRFVAGSAAPGTEAIIFGLFSADFDAGWLCRWHVAAQAEICKDRCA